jgi:cysteine-rich repeat protein
MELLQMHTDENKCSNVLGRGAGVCALSTLVAVFALGGPVGCTLIADFPEKEVAQCGNGAVEAGEDCDDGNTDPGDGCSETCEWENVCGDGTVEPGEECDDGNQSNSDQCPDGEGGSCRTADCGDGFLQDGPDEDCDDGNNESGDGCSRLCKWEWLEGTDYNLSLDLNGISGWIGSEMRYVVGRELSCIQSMDATCVEWADPRYVLLDVHAIDPSSVWAVGEDLSSSGDGPFGALVVYEGIDGWVDRTGWLPADVVHLTGVWGEHSDEVWVVGKGAVYRCDESTPSCLPVQSTDGDFTSCLFEDVHGTSDGNVWAVGRDNSNGQGLIYRKEAPYEWREIDVEFLSTTFYAVWAASPSYAWAVGETADHCAIARWNGTTWLPSECPPSAMGAILRGVWVDENGDAWAVGDNGTILRWDEDDQVWTHIPSRLDKLATPPTLNAVWGHSWDHVWAVGEEGTFLYFTPGGF